MAANISYRSKDIYPAVPSKRQPRAMIEIDGGDLHIYPVADNDGDEGRILAALRFVVKSGVNERDACRRANPSR